MSITCPSGYTGWNEAEAGSVNFHDSFGITTRDHAAGMQKQ
jgi:hypothetical protein